MSYRERNKDSDYQKAGQPITHIQRHDGPCEAIDSTSSPRDRPQVEIATDRLASLASSLYAKIREIQDRLEPVLRNEGEDGEKGQPVPAKVALAAELDDIGDKLQATLDCGKSILDRLEV